MHSPEEQYIERCIRKAEREVRFYELVLAVYRASPPEKQHYLSVILEKQRRSFRDCTSLKNYTDLFLNSKQIKYLKNMVQ